MDDHNKRSAPGQMGIFHQEHRQRHVPPPGDYATLRGEDAPSVWQTSAARQPATNDVPRILTAKTPGSLILGWVREEGGVVACNDIRVVVRIDHPGQNMRGPSAQRRQTDGTDTRWGL